MLCYTDSNLIETSNHHQSVKDFRAPNGGTLISKWLIVLEPFSSSRHDAQLRNRLMIMGQIVGRRILTLLDAIVNYTRQCCDCILETKMNDEYIVNFTFYLCNKKGRSMLLFFSYSFTYSFYIYTGTNVECVREFIANQRTSDDTVKTYLPKYNIGGVIAALTKKLTTITDDTTN